MLKILAVKQKLDFQKFSIFTGVGAVGEPFFTVMGSVYLPSVWFSYLRAVFLDVNCTEMPLKQNKGQRRD